MQKYFSDSDHIFGECFNFAYGFTNSLRFVYHSFLFFILLQYAIKNGNTALVLSCTLRCFRFLLAFQNGICYNKKVSSFALYRQISGKTKKSAASVITKAAFQITQNCLSRRKSGRSYSAFITNTRKAMPMKKGPFTEFLQRCFLRRMSAICTIVERCSRLSGCLCIKVCCDVKM